MVSEDQDGGSVGWSVDPLGPYVRWSDVAAVLRQIVARPEGEIAGEAYEIATEALGE